ncbi:methyl-CpG-binding domain-containing protein 9-like, partial [Trifolium medium]|nr:methyl-CpG-binding domain-containing protein 9-like [Trifolium medium]
RNISLLQDSINSVGSQLLKLSVRRDFLGIDSIGRLYWALATPRGRSRIVVDASAVLQHGRGLSVSKDSAEKFSALQHCAVFERDTYKMLGLIKDSSPLMSQPL